MPESTLCPAIERMRSILDDEFGFTPVAILSTQDFKAPNCVDVSTAFFGPTGNELGAVSLWCDRCQF